MHGSFPIDTIPDVGLNTQNEGLNFEEIYSLGDVNGDKFNDLFAQAGNFGYSNIKLWVGGRNMPYTSGDQANKTWFGTSNGFGRILSNIGDVDGDGVNDIAIGQVLYGMQPDPNSTCNKGRIFIFKGDTNVIGDTGTVSVKDIDNIPGNYYLYEPFPNPFNPSIHLEFRIADYGTVIMKIYDSLGREITTLMNEEKYPGNYEVKFDASKNKLSSGVYFVNLRILKGGKEVFSKSKKITLLK